MKKVKLFENFKNVISKIENMSEKDVNVWKTAIIFLIVVDLVGIYWYLKLKTIGGALLIVLIVFLSFLLFFSRNNAVPASAPEKTDPFISTDSENPQKKNEKPKESEKKYEKENFGFGNMDFGLGTPEEYNERAKRALGDWGI